MINDFTNRVSFILDVCSLRSLRSLRLGGKMVLYCVFRVNIFAYRANDAGLRANRDLYLVRRERPVRMFSLRLLK